ncbi:MAG: KEOPS complex subunit Pcc1 [Euryarchaeota archaeon]|nr:KEOPS complex subunit Pcc1 [Euryarchaeota archaeon]
MKIHCELSIEYETAKKANTVFRSTKVDNFDFVKSEVSGKTLKASMENASISALIHTLDDYLACVSIAEDVVDKS